jgi:pyruvate,orthophosphate dikinase
VTWTRPLTVDNDDGVELIGAKAHGLVLLQRLGLPVPPAFVVTTAACRSFLTSQELPEGLEEEMLRSVAELEARTGRQLGGVRSPLLLSVRSGAQVSMPGMMNTILNLGLTSATTDALALESGDERFALSSRLQLISGFATALTGQDLAHLVEATKTSAGARGHDEDATAADVIEALQQQIETRCGRRIPDDAREQLSLAVETVFSSWSSSRARTYRDLHEIPHELGTAATVQVMVFGNRDRHSGTGVAFSRDPNTGRRVPYGDVLFGHQGEDVVSGRTSTRPLRELSEREPLVWAALVDAMDRIESHYRDACYVEFTFEAGELWILQVRPGRFTAAAAVRLAVDLADEDLITKHDALLRVSPQHLQNVRSLRIDESTQTEILARGTGACPGVAVGAAALTTDAAVRMSTQGPVILVRPETSPHDMRGLAAAAGVVTARGGPASHAAVVARAMGKPAVVGVVELVIDSREESFRIGDVTISEGTPITIDGTSGAVVLGQAQTTTGAADSRLEDLLDWADETSGDRTGRDERSRLIDAHIALGRNEDA